MHGRHKIETMTTVSNPFLRKNVETSFFLLALLLTLISQEIISAQFTNSYVDNGHDHFGTTIGHNNKNNSVSKEEAQAEFFARAASYTTYKIGNFLQKYYFPVFIPIGVIGK